MTVTLALELSCEVFVQVIVMVYVRPVAIPNLCARRSRVRRLVISRAFSTASLLVTFVIWQTGAGSLLSVACTVKDTGTMLLLAGHSTFGVAVTLVIVGALTFRTVASKLAPDRYPQR